jgi:hypothetical protein
MSPRGPANTILPRSTTTAPSRSAPRPSQVQIVAPTMANASAAGGSTKP